MKNKRFGAIRRIFVPLTILIAAVLVVGNLQAITDFARLYNYTPPPDIVKLADETTMTDKARRLFYINHPVVADRSSFNENCQSRGEQTIVLGCYHSVDRGIYLFDVQDQRLNGVEHVTAAHEMLHAAYDRLKGPEKELLETRLQTFYDTKVQDTRIRETMAAYQHSEPDDLINEMHSIFATEIATLTPELEDHYKQYFSDRSKVIGYANIYRQEFTDRKDQVEAYDLRLKDLKNQIDTNTTTLERREADIAAMQRQLENHRDSNNIETYNALVPVYNARVDQYNELIRITQSKISEYNEMVAIRNSLALEVRELTQSISSQLSPIGQ